jgi:membrane protease YdiL (CAAX protease family)
MARDTSEFVGSRLLGYNDGEVSDMYHREWDAHVTWFGDWATTRADPVKIFRLVLLGPLQEEAVFRAVAFHLIANRLPKRPLLSAGCTALLFGLSHAVNILDERYDSAYVMLQVAMSTLIGRWPLLALFFLLFLLVSFYFQFGSL